jgi:hypothetical protein
VNEAIQHAIPPPAGVTSHCKAWEVLPSLSGWVTSRFKAWEVLRRLSGGLWTATLLYERVTVQNCPWTRMHSLIRGSRDLCWAQLVGLLGQGISPSQGLCVHNVFRMILAIHMISLESAKRFVFVIETRCSL